MADVCDVTYACLLEQVEGEDRIERLDQWLDAEPDAGKFVSAEVAELNRALGVA